jgi:hypothetical protein
VGILPAKVAACGSAIQQYDDVQIGYDNNADGDTTVHFYHGGNPSRDRQGAVGGLARWNIFETRNGSNQSTRQWLWGLGGASILPAV